MSIFADQANPLIDPNKDYAEELLGEGKRYKTAAELARGKVEADLFIKKLTDELAELRASLKGEEKLQELMDRLAQAQSAQSGNANSSVNQTNESAPNVNTLSLDDVQKLLEERERKSAEAANLREASRKVQEVYGANAGLVVEQKAASLGMTKAQLEALAKSNPTAFLKIVDADKAPNPVSAPRSSVNPAALKDASGNVKNDKYYAELRRKLVSEGRGSDFYKPEIQREMFRMAKELGEDFYR
jgi:hypothetical protein